MALRWRLSAVCPPYDVIVQKEMPGYDDVTGRVLCVFRAIYIRLKSLSSAL